MYGYGGYGKKKKKFWSTSGWEHSHFGGFSRIIWDYPYIKMGHEGKIEVDSDLRKKEGIFTAEKLIKIYVMKCKEYDLIKYLTIERVVKPNILGRDTQFDVLKLDRADVLGEVMNKSKEFAPLFEHFRDSILNSSIEVEVPEDEDGEGQGGEGEGEGEDEKEGQGEGQGDGEGGEGEGQGDGEDEEGEGEAKEKKQPGGWGGSSPDYKKIKELIEGMAEQKPFAKWGSLSGDDYKPKFITPKDKSSNREDYQPTQEEKQNAEMILKQLDISFDPKSDDVKNLRIGKLDTSKIAEIPAGNMSVYKQTVEEQDTKPFSVCILADMSGSMGNGSRIQSQRHILNTLYLAMSQILPPDKLYIYGHTGEYTPDIYTFYSPYDTEYEKNIKFYSQI